MESMINIIHVLAAISITGLVLIQHGKGADMGASFGGGASGTMFGSVGTGNVLTKATSWLAVFFFATSLSLAIYARQHANQGVENSSLLVNPDIPQATLEVTPAQDDLPVMPAVNADQDMPQVPVGSDEVAAPQAVLDDTATDAEGQ